MYKNTPNKKHLIRIATAKYNYSLEKHPLIKISYHMYKNIIKFKETSKDKEDIINKIKSALEKVPKNYYKDYLARRIYHLFEPEFLDIDEFTEDSREEFIYLDEDKDLFERDIPNLEKQVKTTLEKLNKREQEIIKYSFGFNNERKYNFEEIGKKFGITRERVRQIKEKTLEKLRKDKNLQELL